MLLKLKSPFSTWLYALLSSGYVFPLSGVFALIHTCAALLSGKCLVASMHHKLSSKWHMMEKTHAWLSEIFTAACDACQLLDLEIGQINASIFGRPRFHFSLLDVADTLCPLALLFQRTTAATCPCPCHGSCNGVLGNWAIPAKFNRWCFWFLFNLAWATFCIWYVKFSLDCQIATFPSTVCFPFPC